MIPDRGSEPDNQRSQLSRQWVWILAAIALIWFIGPMLFSEEPPPSLAYSRFLSEIEAENISAVEIQGDQITGELKRAITVDVDGEPTEVTEFRTVFPDTVGDEGLVSQLRAQGATVEVVSSATPFLQTILINLIPILLILGLFVWLMRSAAQRQSGLFDFGKSKARRFKGDTTSVTFDDVAGQDQAKTELAEVVDFLKDPEKYRDIGAKLPKGILLVGPPGTGKTLMARAAAGEAGVPFFHLSATEFVEMFVGVGASRVRDLFDQAKKNQPAIVFIDELDAIGRRRGAGVGQAHDEREQTLNQLLEQMDGFEEREQVVVLAATNRPDVLDPALLRPGRFDREVTVGLPDRQGREGILRIHTEGIPLASDVELDMVARATMGMSGAELANIANEAALIAARRERPRVAMEDFDSAIDKVVLGGPRETPMSEQQRRLVAYHEAGHALTAWSLPHADPVRKVTIIPHGRAGGATTQLPDEERHAYQRPYLLDRIAVLLGGRAAEEEALGEVSTGAEADLVQATKLARRMVTRWGMGSLGAMAYQTDEERPFLGYELARDREISEETAARIDRDISKLLSEQREQVSKLISDRREDLDRLVERLMEEETLADEDLRELFGPPAREAEEPDKP